MACGGCNNQVMFPKASDLRNSLQNQITILTEVRAIEDAILEAAQYGLLEVNIHSTLMTNTTVGETFSIDDISVVNNTLEITAHGLAAGTEVKLAGEPADIPMPLNTTDTYFVIPVTGEPDFLQLASSFLNAINTQPLDITTAGNFALVDVIAPTTAEQFYAAWKGTRIDRSKIEQMNAVMAHFKGLGYKISRQTSQANSNVFEWLVSW